MENLIVRHRDILDDRIDPDYGLLDKLYSNKILSRKELERIKESKSTRNERLLNYIVDKNKGK